MPQGHATIYGCPYCGRLDLEDDVTRLDPDDVRWICIHTAAFDGVAGVEKIDQWHRQRDPPFDMIGYHEVVRRDGTWEQGRPLEYAGAHARGINDRSIGICCEGHGDHEPHTPEQRRTLLARCHEHMKRSNVPAEHVIGHRELNRLIDAGEVDEEYRTGKTCPGKRVSMGAIRDALRVPHALADMATPEVEMFDRVTRTHELPWAHPLQMPVRELAREGESAEGFLGRVGTTLPGPLSTVWGMLCSVVRTRLEREGRELLDGALDEVF